MHKFSPALSFAVLSLAIAGCGQNEQASQKSAVLAKNAPSEAVKMSSSITMPDAELALPEVNLGNVAESLLKAETAFSAMQLEAGKQKQAGAFEWYLAVLRFNPENQKAQAGLKNTVDALILLTRQTIREGDLNEARRLLEVMKQGLVQHPEIRNLQQELLQATKAEVWQKKAVEQEKQKLIIATQADPKSNFAVTAYRKALDTFPEYQPALQAIDRLRSQRERAAMKLVSQLKFEAALIALNEAKAIDGENPQFQLISNHVQGRLNQNLQDKLVLANIALDGLRLAPAQDYYRQAKNIVSNHPEVVELAKRIDEVKHYERYKPHQVFTDVWTMSTSAPEMVVIPYGRFEMGAMPGVAGSTPNELPRHPVNFARGFAIARNEITVAQFRQFIETSGYVTRANSRGWSMVFDEKGGSMTKRENIDWRHDHLGRLAKDDLPVVHINLWDAAAYAKWLSTKTGASYRLPSEAEFEYILRAGNDMLYPWGDQSPKKVVANLAGAGDKSTQSRSWGNAIVGYRDFHWGAAAVRSFPQEPWGTFDVSGNVEEWVQDCWHDSYQRAPNDGSAWINPGCTMGVTRGASWASSLNEARVNFRSATPLKTHNARIGFRVVREL